MALIGNPLMPLHPMQDPLALIHAALAARRVDPPVGVHPFPPLPLRRVDPPVGQGPPGPFGHPPLPLPGHGNLDDYIPDDPLQQIKARLHAEGSDPLQQIKALLAQLGAPADNPGGPMQPAVYPATAPPLHAHLTQSGYGPAEAMHHLGGHEAQAAQLWEQHHPGAMRTGKNIPGWVSEELVPDQARRPQRSRRASMASAALRAS